jgi:membrane protease YdiL (CAAX protease family)
LFTAWHLPSRFLLSQGVEGHAGDIGSVLIGTGVPVFIVGLIFGIFWDRYRSILPLIAAHWGIDLIPQVVSFLGVLY